MTPMGNEGRVVDMSAILLTGRITGKTGRRDGGDAGCGQNGPVVILQPTLDLWDGAVPRPGHRDRVVADSADRLAWLRARARGITATDAARLSGPGSIRPLLREKMLGSGFGGNAYTDHGRAREPEIAAWIRAEHGILPSTLLFHAAVDRRHLATPDGVLVTEAGQVLLAEIKTTNKAWRGIPKHYLRQVWWQQYVMDAERTLLVWEQHEDFVPVSAEPQCRWIDRDEAEIAKLVLLAGQLLAAMDGTGR